MGRTYKAIGINLKAAPLGENDRVLTILTPEYGVIRAIAGGARKHRSKFAGRSNLFVVNHLILAQGRSLDRLTQAETIESYPRLSQDLVRLTAGQYLVELSLIQGLSHQPQEALFSLLREHLGRLERSSLDDVIAHLTHGIFHLLTLAGLSPQVHTCCRTQHLVEPNFNDPHWRVGFSVPAGGIVSLNLSNSTVSDPPSGVKLPQTADSLPSGSPASTHASTHFSTHRTVLPLTAMELNLFQKLVHPVLPSSGTVKHGIMTHTLALNPQIWLRLERILRQYAQYHFDRPIRSAALIDSCFAPDDAIS